MKVIYTLLSLTIVLSSYSCKQSKSKDTSTDSLINGLNNNAGNEYNEGARLMAANDCITCHSIDKKMVGPSFYQIASKYHNDQKFVEYLTNSVIRGSKGAWGDLQMTPHPQVPVRDIHEMVKYILSVQTPENK